jgi:urease alpha subunit
MQVATAFKRSCFIPSMTCIACASPIHENAGTANKTARFDLLICNARIVDGMGNPWYRGDIGVKGGQIAEIGALAGRRAPRTIDAQDRVVTPGFIDLMAGPSEPLITNPASAERKLRQGITTIMVGGGDAEAPQNDRTPGDGMVLDGKKVKWASLRSMPAGSLGHRPASSCVTLSRMRSPFLKYRRRDFTERLSSNRGGGVRIQRH